jgi:hypothetical protein
MMKRLIAGLGAVLSTVAAGATPPTTETIVLVRHGEKPEAGLGQLNCRGLNRALALPAILRRDFAPPAAIFAPNPAAAKTDHGTTYDYVRPLATIEPTAIEVGLPVNTNIGFSDTTALQAALDAPALAHAVVLVAWEHTEIVALARALATAHGGNPALIPAWDHKDFDSIYVLRITRDGAHATTVFERLAEGLNGEPERCPDTKP